MFQFLSKHLLLYIFLFSNFYLNSQVLPSSRSTNWENAGLSVEPIVNPAIVNILSVGGDNSGNNPNDNAFINALNHPSLSNGGTIYFPQGTYRFRATLEIYNRNGIIIKGDGANNTFFKFYSNEYSSTWQWDAIHFRGNLSSEDYNLSANANIGNNSITLQNVNNFSAGDYVKLFQEDFNGIDCLGGNNQSVTGSGEINNCEARHSLAHYSKITSVDVANNKLYLDNPIRFAYQTNWDARIRKFEPVMNCGVESLSLEFIGLTQDKWQPKSIYLQLCAESWIKDVYSYNTGFGHFVVASSTNVEISNCAGHQDFFGSMGGGRGYGIVFEYGSNYCLAENNVLSELRHPIVVQSGANANVLGYNFSNRETGLWADIVMHGNYPFLNLFEGNVGEVYRGDNSGHGVNGPYNTFFRNRATAGITEFTGSTFNQNYIGNEIDGAYNINPNDNFVYANIVNGNSSQTLDDVSYYRESPLPFDQQCAWPSIGFPNDFGDNKTPAELRYEHVTVVAADSEDCNLMYTFNVTQNSNPINPNGTISLASNNSGIQLYWHDFDQLGGSVSNLSNGCYSVFIWNDEGCYTTETFEVTSNDDCHPDKNALLALYNNTNGANWNNKSGWSAGATGSNCNPCSWYGVSCNGLGRVTEINLANNNLNGTIPADLGLIPELNSIFFQNNNLNGCLPYSMTNLCGANVNFNNNPNMINDDFSKFCNNADGHCDGYMSLDLQLKLQGPFLESTGLMTDVIKNQDTFPLYQPYSDSRNVVIGGEEEILNPSILNWTGNNSIVDWVFVELRNGQNPDEVIQTKSALLQRDGDVVSSDDGVSNLKFHNHSSTYSSFVVAVHHRNHLSVRTNSPISTSTTNIIYLDFTSSTIDLFGGDGVVTTINGQRLLKSGDALKDGVINTLDKNIAWQIQNGQVYNYFDSQSDLNLDGFVNSIDKNLYWRINNGSAQNVE